MNELLILLAGFILLLFVTLFGYATRFKRCSSDRILVVYGKISGKKMEGTGLSAKCYHGGGSFIWPIIQDYQYLDLTPVPIDIKLEGALSQQNIRVNTPSTFTVGISTEPGIMENAAERLLGLSMTEIQDLAKDIIFGQLRVVIATMPIEEINADREKLIENIYSGVEVELKKIGLRLINVNIQDITDASGYIDALGKEAAARAINEAKIRVAEQVRDGETGKAEAERDQRINVANADATAVEGENKAGVRIAQSSAYRREQEAEAQRLATAAEKVKSAQALQEAYAAEEQAERERAKREQATQTANIIVPAEIEKRRIETLAEADAEKIRRIKKGEADGLFAMMQAEGEGLKAILTKKAEGFAEIVKSCCGSPDLAALMLITEQLPKLVEEQVKAISNLKIDSITVWDGGKKGDGKTQTADFISGLIGSLPPLHDLTKNVGIQLPEFLGKLTEHPELAEKIRDEIKSTTPKTADQDLTDSPIR
ncbi:MAG: flotillin family protein [Candidatus Omnitrophota bacterium]|jgi:flotillin|nr:MAG: flotillin family protein [Candidatus Omnitrophota bacterium]